jgi:DNA polymerase elongation subunit (family B)
MISLVGDGIKKVLSCKKCPSLPEYVKYYKTEKEMLLAFAETIKKLSPDILTGYYSDKFDLPYIKARADKHKIKLNLGLDGSGIKFSGGLNPRGKLSGISHIDLLNFIETAYSQYLQSETLSLNDVSSELLGEKKHEHEFKSQNKMSHDDWRNFFKYNLQDSNLTHKLFLKAWPDLLEFSKIMQEPLFNVSRDGMSTNVEHYIIHNLNKYNEIIEKKPTHDQIGERRARRPYEGAFVLEPKPKLYDNIVMFDFTSMYGSVIVTYNLSLSTFQKEKSNATSVKLANKTVYFSKKKGFFPEMLEQTINYRKKLPIHTYL